LKKAARKKVVGETMGEKLMAAASGEDGNESDDTRALKDGREERKKTRKGKFGTDIFQKISFFGIYLTRSAVQCQSLKG